MIAQIPNQQESPGAGIEPDIWTTATPLLIQSRWWNSNGSSRDRSGFEK
jgi:hypothetical protein